MKSQLLYLCYKEAFGSYSLIGPVETMLMGNFATTKIEGYEKFLQKRTFNKVFAEFKQCN